ncbi:MAG: hypothetical protein LBL37_04045, partial [Gracilibacteraceae bacterium]|nr:hypothetical protein [Gracilibacteraceae bacterium]
MRSNTMLTLLLALALSAAVLTGCSPQTPAPAPPAGGAAETPPAGGETLTVTDDAGHEVTLTLPVERVALLDTGPGTALAALGRLDVVTGTHQALQNSLYAEIAEAPMVATYAEINYEALAETRPQLVLSAT